MLRRCVAKYVPLQSADVEDVCSEAWSRAYRRQITGPGLRRWIVKTAIREAWRTYHSDARRNDCESPLSAAANRSERHEAVVEIQDALARLDDDHREVLLLHQIGLTLDEMSAVTGGERRTAASRLYGARQSLREQLLG